MSLESDIPPKPAISNKNLTKQKNLEFFENMRDSIESQIQAKLIEEEYLYKLRSIIDEYCKLVKPKNPFKIREVIKSKNHIKTNDLNYIAMKIFDRVNNFHKISSDTNEIFAFNFSVELKITIKSNIELLKQYIERFEGEMKKI